MGEFVAGRSIQSRLGRLAYRLISGAPFRAESDAIRPSEWLLRRIPHDYFDAELASPIQRAAFRPTDRDVDGISLFREMHLSPKDLSSTGTKAPYVVGRIRASEIERIGLTLLPTPDPTQPPGHVSVPQLNTKSMKINKSESKEYQFALANVCTVAYLPKFLQTKQSTDRSAYCFAATAI